MFAFYNIFVLLAANSLFKDEGKADEQ